MPTGQRKRLESLVDGDTDARPFVPTVPQLRYLRSWLDPTSPDTVNGLADHAKVPRRTVYGWFEDPAFCAWFTHCVEQVFVQDRHRMWKRCIELATKGSPEHIRLVALRGGELRQEGERPGPLQVFLNIPRPHRNELPAAQDDVIDVTRAILPPASSQEEH